jgi:hypothetical protein
VEDKPHKAGIRASLLPTRLSGASTSPLLFRKDGLELTAHARLFMLSTASLSALGYEGSLDRPVIPLWNETRHVEE